MRIAIIKPSALGDIVHALPVLSALRGQFPDAHITWIVNQSFEGLLKGHPQLDATMPFDRSAFGKGSFNATRYAWQFSNELRRQRFDWAIDLQGLARTGMMTLATGARRKIGFANAREGARFAYTELVEVGDAETIHAVDRYWKIIEHLGARSQPKQFHLPVSPERSEWVRQQWQALPKPWYAVAVGAKWLTKRWPPEHFAALIAQAQSQFGGTAIFVGVKDDSPISQSVIARLPGPSLDWCGQTDLPTLAAALAQADVMIANDTGPLHLAAALGTPCVAPYTCTKVVKHGPYLGSRLAAKPQIASNELDSRIGSNGSINGAIETTVPCGGSYLKNCPNGLICFGELTPDKLWPPLEKILVRNASLSGT